MIIQKIKNVDDTYFDVFMSISEALTGFSVFDLHATGLANEYYKHLINSISQPTLIDFLKRSSDVFASSTKYSIENEIILKLLSDNEIKKIANKIITLWYQGTWEGKHIHENAYKEGLIWKAIHSHPPGAKQPGFKSWSINPKTERL